MKDAIIQLLKNLYINQNFIWLIMAYIGVWFAKKHHIYCLCKVSFLLFVFIGLSVLSSLIIYSYEYWMKKKYSAAIHKLEYQKKQKLDRE